MKAYRPALDGVRAVAVAGVLLYHADIGWIPGGILGVDVFFVLSGYLITGLLLREWDRWGSIDVVSFYVHRARRLLPALCLVVIAIAIWAWLVAPSDQLGSYRADAVAALLYVANWRFVFSQQSYFDQFADPSPFRHMWSLAIEEQYYLFFPLLLIGLLTLSKGRNRRIVVGSALGVLAALSVAEMALLFHPGADPSRVYYGTDTRFFELMVGSLLAVMMAQAPRARPRAATYTGVVALVAVVVMMHTMHDQAPFLFRGGFLLLALFTALLLWSVDRDARSPAARLLSLMPLVWIGRISYGLYLWHWPVYVAVSPAHTALHDGPLLVVVRIGISAALAVASYFLVEHPIRTGALRRMRPPLGRVVAAMGLPVALLVTMMGTAGATAKQLPESPFGVNVGAGAHRLLVVGDSVAMSLGDQFPAAEYPDWQVQSVGKLGCGLAENQQLAFNGTPGIRNDGCGQQIQLWRQRAAAFHPDAVLMVVGAWEVFDHVVDGRTLTVGSPEYAAFLRNELEKALAAVAPSGTKLFLTNVPCFDQQSSRPGGFDIAPGRNSPTRRAAVNDVIDSFAAAHPSQVQVLDLASRLCPQGTYVRTQNGVVMRPDGVHFSRQGAEATWTWIMDSIGKVRPQPPSGTTVLTIGDSVPLGLFEKFPRTSYPRVRELASTQLGCGLLPVVSLNHGQPQKMPGNCVGWAASLPAVIAKVRPDIGLVFAGIGEQFDKSVDGKTLVFGSPEWRTWMHAQLAAKVDLFTQRGVPVILPTVPCHNVVETGTGDVASVINDPQRIDVLNSVVRQVAADYPRRLVRVADVNARLCTGGYHATLDGVTLRYDGLHFTSDGTALVWKYLMPEIHSLLRKHRTTTPSSGVRG